MAAVAVKKNVARSGAAQRSSATRKTATIGRVRVKHRKRSRFTVKTGLVLGMVFLALLFCYINVYANLTTTGYNRSRLDDLCRQARIENQRLKVELTELSSPHNVVFAAQKSGMVYATQYDYLPKSEHVASLSSQPAGTNQ